MAQVENHFRGHRTELDSPARELFAITPHDSTNFNQAIRGIYVGSGGDIAVVTQDTTGADRTVVVFKNAVAGSIIPVQATRVNSTSTTATDLVGLV